MTIKTRSNVETENTNVTQPIHLKSVWENRPVDHDPRSNGDALLQRRDSLANRRLLTDRKILVEQTERFGVKRQRDQVLLLCHQSMCHANNTGTVTMTTEGSNNGAILTLSRVNFFGRRCVTVDVKREQEKL